MASILVRNLDDAVKERLRARARRNNRSLEAEVRLLLVEAAPFPKPEGVGTRLQQFFKGLDIQEGDLQRPNPSFGSRVTFED